MADDGVVAFSAQKVTSASVVVVVTDDPEAVAELSVDVREAVVLPHVGREETAALNGTRDQLTLV